MEQVTSLDEDFGDVMSDLRGVKAPKTNGIQPKSETDIKYDMKVKEVALDRRAAPADRTKTPEELAKERQDQLAKMEADRLRRMQGDVDDDEQRGDADDLDGDFWAGDSENEEEGFRIKDSDDEAAGEGEESDGSDDEKPSARDRSDGKPATITIGGKVITLKGHSSSIGKCPSTLDELLTLTEGVSYEEVIPIIRKVFQTYQPRMGAENTTRH
ncbi:unnamed protein product [Ambrosiozyma monospora]|uniref:Unnamed protein product n=1 Tax=Ambrosiozyma monospora TaxID=43982 RepID=A0ACB5UCU7_AMBMO|nr:unnamed protein product [Ambrosiozyma monospora]